MARAVWGHPAPPTCSPTWAAAVSGVRSSWAQQGVKVGDNVCNVCVRRRRRTEWIFSYADISQRWQQK